MAPQMKHGLTAEQAHAQFVIMDVEGAIGAGRKGLSDAVQPFCSDAVADKARRLRARVYAGPKRAFLGA